MDFGEPEPMQVKVDNINLKKLLDPEFVELLEDEFKEIKAVNITIIVDDELKDMITLGHPFVELEEENKLVIDVNDPLTLKKTFEVLKNYKK